MTRRTRTVLAGVAGASIVLGSALLVATPAAAAIGDGQTITVIDTSPGTTFTVDQAAELTPVGASGVTELLAVDVDEDGLGYAIMGNTATNVQSVLYDFDATTGAATDPHPITFVGGPVYSCMGLDYSGGVIIAGCLYAAGNSRFVAIGAIDPATGVFDGDITTTNPSPVTALAKDPDTGTIWVFDGLNAIYNADLTSDTYTPVAVVQGSGRVVYAADFDRDDQLVISYSQSVQSDPPEAEWHLGTIVPGTGVITDVGVFDEVLTPGNHRIEALTVWGEVPLGEGEDPGSSPALPATGAADGSALLAGAIALLLLGAVVLLAVRRRTI